MRNFCLNTAGIKIDWNKGGLGVKKTEDGATQFIFFLESEDMINRTPDISWRMGGGNWEKEPASKTARTPAESGSADIASEFELMSSLGLMLPPGPPRVDVEKLRKMPFSIHLSRLILDRVVVDAPLLAEIEAYLTGIPVNTIREIKCENVRCWPEMLKFMTKYKVKELDSGEFIPDDALKAISALNLTMFAHIYDAPVDFISKMTFPNLCLREEVSPETAKAIVQKAFSFPEVNEWIVAFDAVAEFKSFFANHQLLDFDHSGPLPERRPLVFVQSHSSEDEVAGNNESGFNVYILRADGRMIGVWCSVWTGVVSVSVYDYAIGPPALKALIDPK